MMKRATLILAVLGLLFVAAGQARAGVIYQASYDYDAGLGQAVNQSGSKYSISIPVSLSADSTVTAQGVTNFGTYGTVSMTVSVHGHAGLNGVGLSAYFNGNNLDGDFTGPSVGNFLVEMTDSFHLVAMDPKISILPGTNLSFKAYLDGTYSNSGLGGFGVGGYASGGDSNGVFGVNVSGKIGTISLGSEFQATLDSQLSGSYYLGLEAYWQLYSGTHSADLDHTLQITSITLPDGTTPEQDGYKIVFDSGRLSPNISPNAVPEPSTLTLFVVGLAGMLGYGWSRRKRAVMNEQANEK